MITTQGRKIPQFNGTDMYGVFNTPLTLATTNTFVIDFWTSRKNTSQFLIDGAIEFDATNLIQLTNCTATIDDVAITGGDSILNYIDDNPHTLIITATAPITITYIGRALTPIGYWSGGFTYVHDVTANDKYTLNSGSATIEYADGESSPSTKYITYVKFSTDIIDWPNYRYNTANVTWDWTGSSIAGSVLWEFATTADTPTGITSYTISGTNHRDNWHGLDVGLNKTSHTYNNMPPVGTPVRFDLETPATCTLLFITGWHLSGTLSNLNTLSALVILLANLNDFTEYKSTTLSDVLTNINLADNKLVVDSIDALLIDLADSVQRISRAITVDISGGTNGSPTAAGLAAKAIIVGAGGSVAHN